MAYVSEKFQGIEKTEIIRGLSLPLQSKASSIRRDPSPNMGRVGHGVGPDYPLSAV